MFDNQEHQLRLLFWAALLGDPFLCPVNLAIIRVIKKDTLGVCVCVCVCVCLCICAFACRSVYVHACVLAIVFVFPCGFDLTSDPSALVSAERKLLNNRKRVLTKHPQTPASFKQKERFDRSKSKCHLVRVFFFFFFVRKLWQLSWNLHSRKLISFSGEHLLLLHGDLDLPVRKVWKRVAKSRWTGPASERSTRLSKFLLWVRWSDHSQRDLR